VIRGYYFNGRRDKSIRTVFEGLFNLRLKYKNEGNPTQKIIKLLLNSIYGKTILKPIETNVKMIKKVASDKYVYRDYNSIFDKNDFYSNYSSFEFVERLTLRKIFKIQLNIYRKTLKIR
jgi:hypothetical protein